MEFAGKMSTRPNPLDGTAVIPLPPGMALDQFLIFQSSLGEFHAVDSCLLNFSSSMIFISFCID